jgi:hypothetical protein
MNIITFYNKIIRKDVVELQKKVFSKFGYTINQIYVENWKSHGEAIDEYLNKISNENEIIILFDIDAIPLNSSVLNEVTIWCQQNIGIVGIAQNAPKTNDYIIYASPAFMAFSIKTYNFLGRPSFIENKRSDCGTEMTHSARKLGVEVRLFYPTNYEEKTFKLDGYIHYGYGCNYENKIYHSFESRFGKKDGFFIKKCKSLLKNE